MKMISKSLFLLFCVGAAPQFVLGEDWPTYRHDNRRSAVTSETPKLPLSPAWVRRSAQPPMTAWSGPAKWDAFAANDGLQSMRNFDPAFFVTVAAGSVYFGSSVDHAVHSLDAATGDERWVAFAGGAVRLPPAIDGGRAYFGADDGFGYCVDAASGKELWKYRPAPSARLIPSDTKLISPWPVRSGVLVQDGGAYFAASLVPWEESYLCGLDAVTGEERFRSVSSGVTLQGAMLASTTKLYAPQGRSVPIVYDSVGGKQLKSVSGTGGTFCLLTEDERLVAMPANQKSAGNVIQIADPNGGGAMLRFAGADRLLVAGSMAYVHQAGKLKALDRVELGELETAIQNLNNVSKSAKGEIGKIRKEIKKLPAADKGKIPEMERRIAELERNAKAAAGKVPPLKAKRPACYRWEAELPAPLELILAGEVLFLGGDGEVLAVSVKDGKQLWSAKVEGKAYGIVFSGGNLIVSTGLGHIYCFRS